MLCNRVKDKDREVKVKMRDLHAAGSALVCIARNKVKVTKNSSQGILRYGVVHLLGCNDAMYSEVSPSSWETSPTTTKGRTRDI